MESAVLLRLASAVFQDAEQDALRCWRRDRAVQPDRESTHRKQLSPPQPFNQWRYRVPQVGVKARRPPAVIWRGSLLRQ